MRDIFGLLKHLSINPGTTYDVVSSWSARQAIDFIVAIEKSIPHSFERAASPFEFVASRQLAGGPHPCMAMRCRMSHADAMARYAALYADRVLIPDPFERYFDMENFDETVRFDIASDILILFYFQPLIEQGLIGFASSIFHFCEDCWKTLVAERRPFERRITKVEAALKSRLLTSGKFSVRNEHGVHVVYARGPEELIDHGSQVIVYRKPLKLRRKLTAGQSHKLTRTEADRLKIAERFVYPVVGDIMQQEWYGRLYGSKYVTDRSIDFDILRVLESGAVGRHSDALMEGLKHVVPVIANAPLKTLLKLRAHEGDAFRVYRDSISQVLRDAKSVDPRVVREAFDDIVRPELNKLRVRIDNSRKAIVRELKRDLVISAGTVAIGLFGGLLPANVGDIVSALGGLKFAHSVLDKAIKLREEPEEAKGNSYYFLWKVQQSADRPRKVH